MVAPQYQRAGVQRTPFRSGHSGSTTYHSTSLTFVYCIMRGTGLQIYIHLMLYPHGGHFLLWLFQEAIFVYLWVLVRGVCLLLS